jgi:hypothetical protein
VGTSASPDHQATATRILVGAMKQILPPYYIPLTATELKSLGELCAIQGQVEHLLIVTLSYVLDIKENTARTILVSNSLHTNTEIWIALFREKCGDDEVLNDAEAAYALVEGITQGRNDFVHAVFAIATGTSWMLAEYKPGKEPRPKRNQAVALRTRNMKRRLPISDLAKVRNDAARLSLILSKIAWAYLQGSE